MSSQKKQGYFGFLHDWSPQVAAPHPEYLIAFNNGDCLIEFWAPRKDDDQLPHDRDEVYVIVSGTSSFQMDGVSKQVQQGDMIFVPAGVEHQFFDLSSDLSMWIVFFGPRHDGFDATP